MSSPRRVLVVDDDEAVRALIRVNLELEGFDVHTATDGRDCLEQVRRRPPDLVTLDVAMPRVDGLNTAAALRTDPATSGVRIVLITAVDRAWDRARDQLRSTEIGVDAYLAKPFTPEDLLSAVQKALARPAAEPARWASPAPSQPPLRS